MFQPNSDQKNILKFVLAGHNILVTGQAGAGKSELVRESIKGELQSKYKCGLYERSYPY
jgi:tRNA A37 threonylcarbamoyladenosine biosynthesis protein TsaE